MTMSMGTKPLSSEGGPVRIPGKDRKDRKDCKDHDTSSIIIRQRVPENIRIRRKYTTSYNNSSNSMQLYAILKIRGDSKMLLRSCNAQKSPISIKHQGREGRKGRGGTCAKVWILVQKGPPASQQNSATALVRLCWPQNPLAPPFLEEA